MTNAMKKRVRDGAPCIVRSMGCLSNKTALARIFKLAKAAEKSWRHPDGLNQFPKVISVQGSPTESRSSVRKRKPLPPDPFRHQDSAIAHGMELEPKLRCGLLTPRARWIMDHPTGDSNYGAFCSPCARGEN